MTKAVVATGLAAHVAQETSTEFSPFSMPQPTMMTVSEQAVEEATSSSALPAAQAASVALLVVLVVSVVRPVVSVASVVLPVVLVASVALPVVLAASVANSSYRTVPSKTVANLSTTLPQISAVIQHLILTSSDSLKTSFDPFLKEVTFASEPASLETSTSHVATRLVDPPGLVLEGTQHFRFALQH
jgi:predicted neutral ceramidase superfamily lipid hydrolase